MKKHYDVVVIGSGAGLNIVNEALNSGLKVALFEKSLVGGTCLNVGCIPSKMLIAPADLITQIENSNKFHIKSKIENIDFLKIINETRENVEEDRKKIEKSIPQVSNLDFYAEETYFIDKYTLHSKNGPIVGDKIFIAAGARVAIPKIKGIEKIDYLTNDNLLQIKKRPESIVIIGGGYIGVESAHFFASMGVQTTIIQRRDRLIMHEEPEIAKTLEKNLSKRVKIFLNSEVVSIIKKGNCHELVLNNKKVLQAEAILIAAGRIANSDKLKVENTGVKGNKKGFVMANDYLETNIPNIYAIGDILGKEMYRHSANREAGLAWYNANHENKIAMDYSAVPHAIFTWPQIAAVGLTEEEARKEHEVLIGKAKFNQIAKGQAIKDKDSFAKVIVDKNSKKILGFHIIGPEAAILIQEVVNIMANKGDISDLVRGIHIHPAMSEIILKTFENLTPED